MLDRNSRSKLGDAMVEERAMDLQADRHGGAVDLAQDVVRQITDGVAIHHAQHVGRSLAKRQVEILDWRSGHSSTTGEPLRPIHRATH